MILQPAQRKALERALATAHGAEDRISYLEKLSAVSPAMADRVAQLRERQKWLTEFATIALSADDASN